MPIRAARVALTVDEILTGLRAVKRLAVVAEVSMIVTVRFPCAEKLSCFGVVERSVDNLFHFLVLSAGYNATGGAIGLKDVSYGDVVIILGVDINAIAVYLGVAAFGFVTAQLV